jgi:hypothetical protein
MHHGAPQSSLFPFSLLMKKSEFDPSVKYIYIYIYRVSLEECIIFREGVPYVKIYQYNPKHPYPKLNGYGDNGQKSLEL